MNELFELDENTQAFLDEIGAAIEADEAKPQMVNVLRLYQLQDAYRHLQILAEENWKVSCVLHEPYPSMAVLSVEAEEFTFDRMQELHQVLAHASNVEIYPLINGNLRMNITFHGITKKL